MLYEQMTQKEQTDVTIQALYQREQEYFYHDHNRRVYEAISLDLPAGPWPAELEKYRGTGSGKLRQSLASDRAVAEAIKYAWRDELQTLLAEAVYEMEKVRAIYGALRSQLPPETASALISAAVLARGGVA